MKNQNNLNRGLAAFAALALAALAAPVVNATPGLFGSCPVNNLQSLDPIPAGVEMAGVLQPGEKAAWVTARPVDTLSHLVAFAQGGINVGNPPLTEGAATLSIYQVKQDGAAIPTITGCDLISGPSSNLVQSYTTPDNTYTLNQAGQKVDLFVFVVEAGTDGTAYAYDVAAI